MLEPNDRARLRRFLGDRFSLDELETLAFDLGLNYQALPHATTAQLSMALVDHFERRDNINYLLTEVLKQRQDPGLAQLSAKLPTSTPYPKVQIIIAKDIQANPDEIIADLAAKLMIGIDQVQLISAAWGSLRLLVSLPQEAANTLCSSDIQILADASPGDISVTSFDLLDEADQKAWRLLVALHGPWPPVAWNDIAHPEFAHDQLTPRFQKFHITTGFLSARPARIIGEAPRASESMSNANLGKPFLIAGIIGLLVSTIGLAALSMALILDGQTDQLWERLLILGSFFMGAIGLFLIGARGMKTGYAKVVIRFYTYVYAFLAAISYACFAVFLNVKGHSQAVYAGFCALLMFQVIAFGTLRLIGKPVDHGWLAVPLMTTTTSHGALLVVVYVILHKSITPQLLSENISLFLVMLLISAAMYVLSELPESAKRRAVVRTKLYNGRAPGLSRGLADGVAATPSSAMATQSQSTRRKVAGERDRGGAK